MEITTQVLDSEGVTATLGSAAKLIRKLGPRLDGSSQPKTRSESSWRDSARRSLLPIFAGEKASRLPCIIPDFDWSEDQQGGLLEE